MTDAIPNLESERLLLRPLRLGDAAAIQAVFPQWQVVRFLTTEVPWPYPPDGAEGYIRDLALPAMDAGREWHWSIRRKQAPEPLIGVISLKDKPDNNRGFWIDPAHQRQGYATEASLAVTDYWFEVLRRPVLRVPKAVANAPSRQISRRLRMRVVDSYDDDYVSGRMATELWEIKREEWRAFREAMT